MINFEKITTLPVVLKSCVICFIDRKRSQSGKEVAKTCMFLESQEIIISSSVTRALEQHIIAVETGLDLFVEPFS